MGQEISSVILGSFLVGAYSCALYLTWANQKGILMRKMISVKKFYKKIFRKESQQ